MKENKIQILVAYAYHAIFILLSFLMMQNDYNALQIIAVIADIFYLIYWILLNRKGHMAWIVYLNFAIGTAIEITLNWFGIIPEDGGLFFPGLAQFFYIIILLIHVALLGIANLILWLIDKQRHKNQIANSNLS